MCPIVSEKKPLAVHRQKVVKLSLSFQVLRSDGGKWETKKVHVNKTINVIGRE